MSSTCEHRWGSDPWRKPGAPYQECAGSCGATRSEGEARLEVIRARLPASGVLAPPATAPWWTPHYDERSATAAIFDCWDDMRVLTVDEEGPGLVDFIAHTPEDIDFLLDEHARLLEEHARLTAEVEELERARIGHHRPSCRVDGSYHAASCPDSGTVVE